MKKEEVFEMLRRRPFVAFDIKMSDGRVYSVDHPEFATHSRHGNSLYLVTEDDRLQILDVHHIVTLDVANRSSAA